MHSPAIHCCSSTTSHEELLDDQRFEPTEIGAPRSDADGWMQVLQGDGGVLEQRHQRDARLAP
jgi:hypothetical protein